MPENMIIAAGAAMLAAVLMGFVVLGVLAYREFRDYLRSKGYEGAYEKFLDYAQIVVRALEQQGLTLNLTGPEKFQMAVDALYKASVYFGIKVNEDMLGKIVEGAVQILNTEAGKFIKSTELYQDMQEIQGENS